MEPILQFFKFSHLPEGLQGVSAPFSAMAHLGLLTFCVLLLKNGYTVPGTSACASPENYNREIGERLAKEDAIKKMWPLLGYELKNKLYHLSQGADLPQGKAEPQASADSPVGAGEATGA